MKEVYILYSFVLNCRGWNKRGGWVLILETMYKSLFMLTEKEISALKRSAILTTAISLIALIFGCWPREMKFSFPHVSFLDRQYANRFFIKIAIRQRRQSTKKHSQFFIYKISRSQMITS